MIRQRLTLVCMGAVLGMSALAATAQGLGHGPVDGSGSLQARVALGASSQNWSGQSGIVLGDYYFDRLRPGGLNVSGGFRATSGVLLGQRSAVLGAPTGLALQPFDAWSAMPYVGIGWSGVSLRKGWGVSADLGLAVRGSNGGLRIGSTQSLDDLLRELRLTPMLQVGVSYAF